jgi:hypothetical protein
MEPGTRRQVHAALSFFEGFATLVALSLSAAVVLPLAACGGASEVTANGAAIAFVDGTPVPAGDLDVYLALTLGEEAEQVSDQVKSQLLEQLLVYRLLAEEATLAGHTVGRAEVARRLEKLGLRDGGPEGEGVPDGFLRLLRQSILVDGYLAEDVVGEVEVTAEELEQDVDGDESDELGPLVVYRQAMTSSREEALEIVERVTRDREPFVQVAGDLSLSPDEAQPHFALVGQLPRAVGRALAGGPKGGVIGPVPVECDIEEYPDACRYYVFLIEDRRDAGSGAGISPEDRRETIRRGKQAERLEQYLDTLWSSGRIEVRAERLPFRYVASTEAVEEESP